MARRPEIASAKRKRVRYDLIGDESRGSSTARNCRIGAMVLPQYPLREAEQPDFSPLRQRSELPTASAATAASLRSPFV